MVFGYFYKDFFFKKPNETMYLSAIVKAANDDAGNVYVLNDSGKYLMGINTKDKVFFQVRLDEEYGTGRDVLVCDDHVYVHVIVKEKRGYRILGDKIISFDREGHYCKTVYQHRYEQPELVTEIKGLYIINDRLAYVQEEANSFTVCSEDNQIIFEKQLLNAHKIVNSYAFSQDGSEIYYCRLNGTIYHYIDGIGDKTLFDVSEVDGMQGDEFSVPRCITTDKDGILYFTDIGRREIYYLNEEEHPVLVEEYEDGTAFADKNICYYVNATRGLIGVTEDTVKFYQEDGLRYINAVKYSWLLQLICVGDWIDLFFCALLTLWLIIVIVRYVIFKMSKYAKIALVAVGVVFLISMIFMGIVLPPFKEQLMNQMFNQAQVLSDSAVSVLDTEALQNIQSASDYDSKDYDKIRQSMSSLFLEGGDCTYEFYVQLYTIQREDIITITYCLMEDTGSMYPYAWTFEGSDEQAILTSKEGRTYSSDSSEGNYLLVLNPILDEEGNAVGLIEVGTDLNSFRNAYNELIWNLFINMACLTVVIVLVIIELMAFFEGRDKYRKAVKKAGKKVLLTNGLLRFVVFIIFFVTNLSTGFLPQYAMTLSSNHSHIPKEVLAAIPISAEVVAGAIFSIWGTYVVEKIGEKRCAVISSFAIVAGFMVRMIPNVWILTAGNALIGAGWGILLLMVNTMIAMKESEDEKEQGFSDYSSAALNGVNCGVVFGGLMTNWFSYHVIFIFSGIVSLVILYYSRKYMSAEIITNVKKEEAETEENNQQVSFMQFIFNRKIISYFIMIVIPVIACGYFLNYMFPILGSEYGLSDTNIGYSYLINGVCVIVFSSSLTRFFSTKVDKRVSLVFATMLYGAAFLIVAHYQNIYACLVALMLLGLSDSFGLPIQTAYYTELNIVKRYGYDKAIGIYSLFENGAQAVGSFVFSWVLIYGVGPGLKMVTQIIVLMSIGFLLISFVGRRTPKKVTGNETT